MTNIKNYFLISMLLVISSCSSVNTLRPRPFKKEDIATDTFLYSNKLSKKKDKKQEKKSDAQQRKPFENNLAPIEKQTLVPKTEHFKINTIDQLLDKHEFTTYKNSFVEKWINYFLKKDKVRFSKFIQRGAYYKELIQTVLEEEELPAILYYLPLIESGFKLNAYSRASAVGPWQFIKGTAKRYGLIVNSLVDERKDPVYSTEAAVKYLNDLYNVFNSWELALAAYNCGEIRVLRAIMKGKTRNFWELVEKKLLPRETRNYVPKFLAAAYIGENLSKYNLKIDNQDTYPNIEVVEVPGGVSLKTISKHSGIPYDKLAKINPALKKKRTPGWQKKYDLWTYPEYKSKLNKSYKKIALNSQEEKKHFNPRIYRVKKGDSLIKIAKRHKISLNRLKRYNSIRGSRIFIGQVLKVRKSRYKKIVGKKVYFVKRNDFLGKVARKFDISVPYLKRLNGLLSNKLYVGQKLSVSKGITKFRYKVKRGDSLIKIAKLYKKSLNYIRNKNSMKNNRIYIGQILII